MGSRQVWESILQPHIVSYTCIQETISAEELSQLISELNVTMASYQVPMSPFRSNYMLQQLVVYNNIVLCLYFIRSMIQIVKWTSFLFKNSKQHCQCNVALCYVVQMA